MTKAQLQAEKTGKILSLLDASNYAVEEAVLRLFDRQTADEQTMEATTDHNGMGFNGLDAPLLSSFAKQIRANRYGKARGERLTYKQMQIARRKMRKYVKQLVTLADAKAAGVTP